MKRILMLVCLTGALAGCDLVTPKEELACMELLNRAVVDPSSISINSISTDRFDGSIVDLRKHFAERFDGKIPEASSKLLDLYDKQGVKIDLLFTQLDVTFDNGLGKGRSQALCSYLRYGGETELRAFTWRNKDYSQKDLSLALLLDKPKHLDSSFRLK